MMPGRRWRALAPILLASAPECPMRTGRAAVSRYPRLRERCRRCHVDAEHDNNEAKIERYQPQRSVQRSKDDRWDDHEHAAEPGTPELKKRLTKLVAVRLNSHHYRHVSH